MNAPETLPAPPLSRQAERTLAEQLAAHFAERIRQRLLLAGARLPSVRECARRHGLSPSTVVAAYDRLLAAGPGRGAAAARLLRARGPARRPAAGAARRAATGTRLPLPVSATTLIRGMFQPPGALPMPGLGTLPADWLDLPLLAAALHKVSRGAAFADCSLRYGEPAGDARLRQALAHKLAEVGVTRDAAADHHHHRRDPGAGRGDAHAAARRRCGAGRRARLGGGVRPAGGAGHARAAGAARRGRPRPGA